MYYGLLSLAAKVPSASYDSDAQAFFTATGITDNTQKSAVNQLVLDLKSASIWTKMKAIYPFVGGTATTHKYNLKDPQDTDAAFRLVFNGGWTHSSTGAKPNGTNGYADTNLIPNSVLPLNDSHLSFTSRTINATGFCLIGTYPSSSRIALYNSSLCGINSSGWISGTSGNGITTFIGSRTSSTNIFLRCYGVTTSSSQSSSSLSTSSINISRLNNYNGDYSPNECSFSSIGLGLTTLEASILEIIINTYNTTLSRNV